MYHRATINNMAKSPIMTTEIWWVCRKFRQPRLHHSRSKFQDEREDLHKGSDAGGTDAMLIVCPAVTKLDCCKSEAYVEGWQNSGRFVSLSTLVYMTVLEKDNVGVRSGKSRVLHTDIPISELLTSSFD